MKNIEVDNDKISHGFQEAGKVLDHYILSGWIVPCPNCGTWLTSLGLCSDCGKRFEVKPMGAKEEGCCEVCGKEATVQIAKRHLGLDKVVHEFCNDCADKNAYLVTKW